jgi:hypothetical protein
MTPTFRRSLYGPLLLLFVVGIGALVGAPAWAAYVIYVRGTDNFNPATPNTPINTIFNGSFNAGNTVQYVQYPATFGAFSALTYKGGYGPLPPTLNRSVAIGVQNLDALIKADQKADPNEQIYVIGLSQGAIVGTVEANNLTKQGPSAYKNVTFILPGNPDRSAPSGGGILTQTPIAIVIPGVATVGGRVLSTPPPTNGPTIIDVTNQGDPYANFTPTNPLNDAGELKSVISGGFTGAAGPHDYYNTVLTPAMVSGTNPYPTGDVVTKSGNVTDVFIPSTTPNAAPLLPLRSAPPVKTFQQVSGPAQSGSSTPRMTSFSTAATQPSLSTPKPVDGQRVTNPTRH